MTTLYIYCSIAIALYIVAFFLMDRSPKLHQATRNTWLMLGIIVTAPLSLPIVLILLGVIIFAKIMKP